MLRNSDKAGIHQLDSLFEGSLESGKLPDLGD
jgi:hypothetical protein